MMTLYSEFRWYLRNNLKIVGVIQEWYSVVEVNSW